MMNYFILIENNRAVIDNASSVNRAKNDIARHKLFRSYKFEISIAVIIEINVLPIVDKALITRELWQTNVIPKLISIAND